jgi:hypothetical protein
MGRRVCVLVLSGQLAWGRVARPEGNADAGVVAVPRADEECLRALGAAGIAFRPGLAGGGMHTPVEITGPIGPVTLVPLGRSRPVMDCRLARALYDAREVFATLQIRELRFSAAFDYRTRRDSDRLSAHAFGLAIDVHLVETASGEWSVLRDFEAGVGTWKGLHAQQEGALESCVGNPQTDKGRALRTLACRLKLHPAFAVIVTPDDNSDHRNHLHLEARADFFPVHEGEPLPPPPQTAGAGDAGARPTASRPARRSGKVKRRKLTSKKKRTAKKRAAPRAAARPAVSH